jgi:hypothetical protein
MQSLYSSLVAIHGLTGLVALISFWLAGFARKGSPLHLRSGRVYLLAMLGIVITALPMSAYFFVRDRPGIGTFLLYLVVITATSMWLGYRAIRMKRGKPQFYGRSYAWVGGFNVATAAIVLTVGISTSNPLLIGFSAIGALLGGGMLRRLWRPIEAGNWWLQEHYGAMIGCGAATHVAFLAIGFNRLAQSAGFTPPPGYNLLAWGLPVAVSVIAGILLDRRYAKPRKPLAQPTPQTAP